jgi:hypothetical protein
LRLRPRFAQETIIALLVIISAIYFWLDVCCLEVSPQHEQYFHICDIGELLILLKNKLPARAVAAGDRDQKQES